MKNKLKENLVTYTVAIALPLAVGLLSAFLTRGNMSLYSEIKMPPLAPPSWVFPAVWSVLYVLMGVSSALVFTNASADPIEAKRGLTAYLVSLFVNFFWSIIFFNLRAFIFALVWLLLLLFLIIKTVTHYKRVVPIAAYLQIPYIIWVLFAGYLNLAIAILN